MQLVDGIDLRERREGGLLPEKGGEMGRRGVLRRRGGDAAASCRECALRRQEKQHEESQETVKGDWNIREKMHGPD